MIGGSPHAYHFKILKFHINGPLKKMSAINAQLISMNISALKLIIEKVYQQ